MILKFPENSPHGPGVYFFTGKNGGILYIGKAKDIRARLRSYFSKNEKDPRIERMLAEASRVRWQTTASEIEALILESQLIKKHQTKFNVLMRDDKQYTSIAVTREDFPIIYTTHQTPKNIVLGRGSLRVKYNGPFTDAGAVKTILKLLRRIFPYCTCRQKHDRHCLNFHINKCLGFCCLKKPATRQQKTIYIANIKAVAGVLGGKKKTIIRILHTEMKHEADKGNFENALAKRDQIEKLERVFENARILRDMSDRLNSLSQLKTAFRLKSHPNRIEGYDISNIQGREAVGSMVVFENGNPVKSEYRKFKIKRSIGPNDTAMLKEVLTRRFRNVQWPKPDLLLIDGGKGQINAAISVVTSAMGESGVPAILSIAKGKLEIFSTTMQKPIELAKLPRSVKDLLLHIDAEAHRFAISYYRTLHGKTVKPK